MFEIIYDNVKFSKIKLPGPDVLKFWETTSPPYTIKKPAPLKDGLSAISCDAALTMLRLHPLIVDHKWSCVCGVRLLQFVTAHVKPDDLVPVGILPKTITSPELKQLIQIDILLSQMLYSVNEPKQSLFLHAKSMPDKLGKRFTPVFSGSVKTIAGFLNCSEAAIYGWKGQKWK